MGSSDVSPPTHQPLKFDVAGEVARIQPDHDMMQHVAKTDVRDLFGNWGVLLRVCYVLTNLL